MIRDLDDLISFYAEAEIRELEILNDSDSEDLTEEDFAHIFFCSKAVAQIIIRFMIIPALASSDSGKRLWAGKYLYKYSRLGLGERHSPN